MEINQVTNKIIGAAIEVHRELGPGLLENIYELCLCREFEICRLSFQRQVEIPVVYKGLSLDYGYRADLIVENKVLVEIKSVAELLPIHEAQVLTYLKMGGWKLGLIFNFIVRLMKNGIRRLVYDLDEKENNSLLPLRLSGKST